MTGPGWPTPTSSRSRARCSRQGSDGAPNQLAGQRADVSVSAADLLDLADTPGAITEAGLRTDVSVGFQYVSFWLGGRGAAAINSLMEDAATAEISRSQIWQWVHHGCQLEDGRTVTAELVRQMLDEETAKIRAEVGEETWQAGRPDETRADLRDGRAVRAAGRVPHPRGLRLPRLSSAARPWASWLASDARQRRLRGAGPQGSRLPQGGCGR